MAPPADSRTHDDDVRDSHFVWPTAWPILLFGAFAALSIFVYSGGLHGAFVSDDYGYIVTSPYTRSLSAESVAEILDPWGQAKEYTVNYAPVHLLLTALERQIFANEVLGYHLVNVFVHALVSVLLVALLRSSRIPDDPRASGRALLPPASRQRRGGGVDFPAQDQRVPGPDFGRSAGLPPSAGTRHTYVRSGHPHQGVGLRGLADGGSPNLGARRKRRRGRRRHASTVGLDRRLGGALCALRDSRVLVIRLRQGISMSLHTTPRWVQVRSIARYRGTRYLVMAATSFGVSAFQEPRARDVHVESMVVGLASAGSFALLWRTATTLRQAAEKRARTGFSPLRRSGPFRRSFPFVNPGG